MRNTFKVARWEIKRNLKNKSFLIGLFLTPIIIMLFMFIPSLLSNTSSDDNKGQVNVIVKDELNMFENLEQIVEQNDATDWQLNTTNLTNDEIIDQLEANENMAYIPFTEDAIEEETLTIYTSEKIDHEFSDHTYIIDEVLKQHQLDQLELTDEERNIIAKDISVHIENASNHEQHILPTNTPDLLKRVVPGVFAGVILFSVIISGMMIFQSAFQEKKDKIAEIILSSITAKDLMQGKIIGYFALGIIQVLVWMGLLFPMIMWKVDIPILKYLFVPELLILLTIAILGYLMFASLFVGLGATIEDVSTSGNFQGLVLMLPFIPFMLIGPIISDTSGIVAQVSSYIPITSPSVFLIRLSMLDDWPWIEITIGIVILLVSVWLMMKLAGKIFQTGILLYGKNATPKEIWKWLKA